jgi:hypothetical protein
VSFTFWWIDTSCWNWSLPWKWRWHTIFLQSTKYASHNNKYQSSGYQLILLHQLKSICQGAGEITSNHRAQHDAFMASLNYLSIIGAQLMHLPHQELCQLLGWKPRGARVADSLGFALISGWDFALQLSCSATRCWSLRGISPAGDGCAPLLIAGDHLDGADAPSSSAPYTAIILTPPTIALSAVSSGCRRGMPSQSCQPAPLPNRGISCGCLFVI